MLLLFLTILNTAAWFSYKNQSMFLSLILSSKKSREELLVTVLELAKAVLILSIIISDI